MKTLKKVNVNGKRVLVRADLNVPIDKNRTIGDDFRIRAVVPTLEMLSRKNAKVILMSHFGRPKERDLHYSLDVVRDKLFEIGISVGFAQDCIGPEVEGIVSQMHAGEIVLLENLRFHPGEEANDEKFAEQLAALGDVYVNEAFGASHRKHASIVQVPLLLPSYGGPLLEKETKFLGRVITDSRKPLVFVMGGVKAKEKLEVLSGCAQRADHICIGGVLANTILKAKGIAVGRSKVAEELVETLKKFDITDPRIHLPVDVVVSDSMDNASNVSIKAVGAIKEDEYILDIGPETSKLFVSIIHKAKTVFWNGPLGLFERPEFARGTEAIARAVAANKGVKVVGGGEAAQALSSFGLTRYIDHISTGGGAMLEFLSGKRLPGLEVLGYYD